MTAITNLYAYCKYPIGRSNLPIVILCHSWGSDANSGVDYITAERVAKRGFFVISAGMRGRNSADGARDASGREVFDIYDALVYARANFSSIVSPTIAAIAGYSGGGGNALACACKFPDSFVLAASYYGMSDYGRNNPDGWYYNNGAGAYTAQIVTAIGDTPANTPDNYYARDATAAISNFSGGKVFMFHDQQDTAVPFVHSTRIKQSLDAAGLTDYSYNISNTGDATRWLHADPNVYPAVISAAEDIWCPDVLTRSAWTIPTSGTITVTGYIVTKRFTIWLNTGLDAAATVVYDTAAGTYTVTPLTSNAVVAVTITQGALTASGNTNGATLFTVA